MLRDNRGMTLVELIAAISILVMVSAVSAQSIPQLLDYYRVNRAVETLSSALRQAQLEAYRTGGSWRVVIDREITIDRAADNRSDCSDDQTVWKRIRSSTFASSRVAVSASSRSCIVFGPSGRVSGSLPSANVDDSAVRTPLLVDGQYGPPVEDPGSYTQWYGWVAGASPAKVVIDPKESRSYRTVEIGVLHSTAGTFAFPTEIQVRGLSPGQETCLGDYTLTSHGGVSATLTPKASDDSNGDGCPGTPPASELPTSTIKGKCRSDESGFAALCRFSIPLTGRDEALSERRYEKLEVTMKKAPGKALYADEVDIGDLFFTLTAGRYSKSVMIHPVTGRVGSR